jgi:DNA helicase-2/ATP-dependent DNA helicase PcrA
MTDVTWTPEQSPILGSTARVAVVRAGPGSGKTKVFAELANRWLRDWHESHGGIAALSFTNAARDEMVRRFGGTLPAPHFVGTLDSFFLRFVVAPFGYLAGLRPEGPRLIPSPAEEDIRQPVIRRQRKDGRISEIPLFKVSPTWGTEQSPGFTFRLFEGKAQPLPPLLTEEAMNKKRIEWSSRGRITHDETHFLAAAILTGHHRGPIRELVARRFPVLLIDEFQDTGHFLGRALLALVEHPGIRAVLVGDPDQCIFGFAGADRSLFSKAEAVAGSVNYSMHISQRCSARVSAVASLLSRSNCRVEPRAGVDLGGAVILIHSDPSLSPTHSSLLKAAALCRNHRCRQVAILVRRRDEKAALLGLDRRGDCPFRAPGPRALHRAVGCLLSGRGDLASRIVEGRLGHLWIENDTPNQEDLLRAGVDPAVFRRHARQLVLDAARCPAGETWGQWSDRMKGALEATVQTFGAVDYRRRLGQMFRLDSKDKKNDLRTKGAGGQRGWRDELDVEILTVHEAKGRQFDAVLVYVSQPRARGEQATCISETWWSTDKESEEREIAFVAVTRAIHLVMLAVHTSTYHALCEKRPEFMNVFDVSDRPPDEPSREI